MKPEELLNQSYTFEDGTVITIIQIKYRVVDETPNHPIVTYTISQGKSIPRKLLMPFNDFIERFGHLFKS